jgi:UPF0755 protein
MADTPPRRSKFGAVTVLVLIITIGGGYAALSYFWIRPTEQFVPAREVTIEKGESFRQISRDLEDAGVVRSGLALRVYGRVSLTAGQIKPGDYAFKGGERIPDVMRHLVNGDFIVVTISIPEGLTVHQIAERVGQSGLACQDEFENAARDGAMVRALGLRPLGAEGYLFPATYRFSPHAKTDDILAAMLTRFYSVLTPEVEARMFAMGLDARRLVTMASIVEKEAKAPSERPLIAGVFYNRLRLNMPLQSDPTAQYELDGSSESAAAAVHSVSAFNTYDFTGLPPGPIANPGLKSIEAALNPTQTEYLYFVAREGGGTHVFSKSFDSHKRVIATEHRESGNRAGRDPKGPAGK